MKYSERTYLAALAALASLRSKMSDAKEQATVDFVADAIAEKADRDNNAGWISVEEGGCEMITYENAMMELNFPGSIGNQKKRRLAELLKTLHEENLTLKADAALQGEEMTNCDKCDLWRADGENCGWTHNGKDFLCVRGHILTAEEKQHALQKSVSLRKLEES